MTHDELLTAFEKLTGLKISVLGSRATRSETWSMFSPTGLKVAEVTVGPYGDGNSWEFGGVSMAFPDDWQMLCNLHETKEVQP